MNPFLTIGEDLHSIGWRWALVGGHAVSSRAVPRFTKDIDLSISVESDAESEEVVRQLHARGYRVLQLLEHEPSGRLATVRMLMPGSESEEPELDLLFASCGIEPEVVAAAGPLEIEKGVVVPVATLGHLIALKVLAADADRRPQDLADLVGLLERASDDDIQEARAAVALITKRGFDRDKDLAADLDSMVRSAGHREIP